MENTLSPMVKAILSSKRGLSTPGGARQGVVHSYNGSVGLSITTEQFSQIHATLQEGTSHLAVGLTDMKLWPNPKKLKKKPRRFSWEHQRWKKYRPA